MKIREAVKDDAPVIIGFQQAMAMETEGMQLDDATITPGVYAVFDDPARGTYYVAEDKGIVVASMMITPEWSDWRNSFVWWFQSVYVVPEYRRKGVFRAMYEFIRDRAIEAGIPGLRLYVELNNTRAMKTYEAMGMDGNHYRLYEWFS